MARQPKTAHTAEVSATPAEEAPPEMREAPRKRAVVASPRWTARRSGRSRRATAATRTRASPKLLSSTPRRVTARSAGVPVASRSGRLARRQLPCSGTMFSSPPEKRGRKPRQAGLVAEPTPSTDDVPILAATTRSKSAAHWDRITDTTRFDWPEIERTASQDGPNQGMAKLLIAARAEGANSRWPL